MTLFGPLPVAGLAPATPRPAELGTVRGATKNEVTSGAFNIYVAISMGNVWFTRERIEAQLLWSLAHTKERVGLLVADELHAVNYRVREGISQERATKRALRKGDEMVAALADIVAHIPDGNRVDIIRWGDVVANPCYSECLAGVMDEFGRDTAFRDCVTGIVKGHVAGTWVESHEERIRGLCEYVVAELPELMRGFGYRGTDYICCTYAQDTDLAALVDDIASGRRFPRLQSLMEGRRPVSAEVVVD